MSSASLPLPDSPGKRSTSFSSRNRRPARVPKPPAPPRFNLLGPRGVPRDFKPADVKGGKRASRKAFNYVLVIEGLVRNALLAYDPPHVEHQLSRHSSLSAIGFSSADHESSYETLLDQRSMLRSLRLAGLETLVLESEAQQKTFVFLHAPRRTLEYAAEAMEIGVRVKYKTAEECVDNQVAPVTVSPQEPLVRVTIGLDDGSAVPDVINVDLGAKQTLADMKRAIASARHSFPVHRQRVRFQGRFLFDPSATLGSLEITNPAINSVVTVTLDPLPPPGRTHFRRQFHITETDELRQHYGWKGFTGAERLQIMDYKITAKIAVSDDGHLQIGPRGKVNTDALLSGGAHVDVARLISRKALVAAFPLHDPKYREKLDDQWVDWSNMFRLQPIDMVRDYFGEKVAFYFLFLQFYTMWLSVPAVVGTIVFIRQASSERFLDNPIVAYFSLFIVCWSVLFYEFWKRSEAAKAYEWDVETYEASEERDRPEFVNYMMRQSGMNVGAVTLKDMIDAGIYYFPPHLRRLRSLLSAATTILGVLVVFFAVFGVVLFRGVISRLLAGDESPTRAEELGARLIAGAMSGVAIVLANVVFVAVAQWLNDWENHRRDSDYERALIVKVFTLQFVNAFTSLFYVAFFEPVLDPDSSKSTLAGMEKLFAQLAGIMVVSQLVTSLKELILPALKTRFWKFDTFKSMKAKRKQDARRASVEDATPDDPPSHAPTSFTDRIATIRKRRVRQWAAILAQGEAEFLLPLGSGVYEEYAEMMLQFGYATMFVAAFPLAPLLAFTNNVFEVRLDAYKFVKIFQRPEPLVASGMGVWRTILNFIITVSIISNVGIVFITSNQAYFLGLPELSSKAHCVGGSCSCQGSCLVYLVWYMFALEHGLIMLKLLLQFFIPDEPDFIAEEKFQTSLFETRKDRGIADLLLNLRASEVAALCDVCDRPIKGEIYYHCLTCGAKDIDLCEEHKMSPLRELMNGIDHNPEDHVLATRYPPGTHPPYDAAECEVCGRRVGHEPGAMWCPPCGDFFCADHAKVPDGDGHYPTHQMEPVVVLEAVDRQHERATSRPHLRSRSRGGSSRGSRRRRRSRSNTAKDAADGAGDDATLGEDRPNPSTGDSPDTPEQ